MPELRRFPRNKKRIGIRHKSPQTGYLHVKVSLSIYLSEIDVYERAVGAADAPAETVQLHNAEAWLPNTSKHGFMGSGNGYLTKKMAEKAGFTIFGPVVNIKNSRSIPWNPSRAITFTKACCDVANIPIHANMGIGVGGVPMNVHPPIDVVSRASKAKVEICRLDGL